MNFARIIPRPTDARQTAWLDHADRGFGRVIARPSADGRGNLILEFHRMRSAKVAPDPATKIKLGRQGVPDAECGV